MVAVLFVKMLVVILFLCDLVEQFQAFLHKVLLAGSQNLVLLQGLAGDVQWQVFGFYDTLHKVEPLRHEFMAIVHGENLMHIKSFFDKMHLLLKIYYFHEDLIFDENCLHS